MMRIMKGMRAFVPFAIGAALAAGGLFLPQMAFAARRFAAEQMPAPAFAMLDLAGRGQLVPLLHAFVCFLLGHSPSIQRADSDDRFN